MKILALFLLCSFALGCQKSSDDNGKSREEFQALSATVFYESGYNDCHATVDGNSTQISASFSHECQYASELVFVCDGSALPKCSSPDGTPGKFHLIFTSSNSFSVYEEGYSTLIFNR